jgi:hypothetical protein
MGGQCRLCPFVWLKSEKLITIEKNRKNYEGYFKIKIYRQISDEVS